MRIGFDISQTGTHKAGCGYFADSLIQELTRLDHENTYILYPHFGTTFWDPNAEAGTRKILLPNVSRKRIGRDFSEAMAFWRRLPADAMERLGHPDIVHCNNYFCPKGMNGASVVYTLYDLSFLEYPELTPEENRNKCFGGVFDAATGADFIVCISHFSRARFLETFPHYPAERTRVVYLGNRFSMEGGTGGEMGRLKGLCPGTFWLSVGTLEPRKNLRRFLRAFAGYVEQSGAVYPMVLVGGKGWLEEDLEGFIDKLGIANNVHVMGYVSDADLIWLYRNCFCFVYPSLYEGFGLPILEAMGQGAAVVASFTSGLPEVGGGAVLYVDPLDVAGMTEALVRVGENKRYREDLKKRSLIQAGKFSWERSAEGVLDVYREVMRIGKLW